MEDQIIAAASPSPQRRRRGAALEDAILDAGWAELSTLGYSAFTIEAVVKRAGTSRPVVYRRWPTRVSLASASIIRFIKANPVEAPDMGNVRDELCALLRQFADRVPPKLMRLLFEMSYDIAESGESFLHERFRQHPLKPVLDRGIARGEIDPAKLTPRIVRVPMGLALHEIVVTARPLTDDALREIVEQIFLPLVRT
uniref:TetR/AcrR family transcriptional regulator n=1 Tax=uncultured Caulobacter sp. TaxID=158749 RepID=UPI0025E0566C|nr:TetR/AcrR family transcriptional regulator [uncultured Caulobacter sp.]